MITHETVPLNDVQQVELRGWLEKGPCGTCEKVVLAKVQALQIKAANSALTGQEHVNYALAATEEMKKAVKYHNFLEVLKELKAQKEPYSTLSIK